MKRLFLTAVFSVAVANAGWATSGSYINYGSVTTPPVIDATNFVNFGLFSIDTAVPYDFSNVRNYTNRNVMRNGILDQLIFVGGGGLLLGSPGFRFDTAPSTTGSRYMAANFYNAPLAGNNSTNARIYADYQLFVSATNIVNRGLLGVSEYGLISLQGKNVDVGRGILQVGALSQRTLLNPEAMFDQQWAVGNVRSSPATEITVLNPRTPVYDVTLFTGSSFLPYTPSRASLFTLGLGTVVSAMGTQFIATNGVIQIIFLRNQNTNVPAQIINPTPSAFRPSINTIIWSSAGTNAFGDAITNFITLNDTLGSNPTNDAFTLHYPFASPPPSSIPIDPPTQQPTNFTILRSSTALLPAVGTNTPFAVPGNLLQFWGPGPITNKYSAYKVKISTTTMDAIQITNTRTGPGRVELTADKVLDLNLARVDGLNYMKISSTNHFNGSSNASISVTYADLSLGSTNGSLNATGLLNPVIPRINGTIDCYSAVWTNDVPAGAVTNSVIFNVLFVDANLQGFTAPEMFNLSLRSTNVTIGDNYIIHDNLWLDTERLTLTSNAVLDIRRDDIVWANAAPRIKSLTNGGSITVPNELRFIGHNANGSDRPYNDFVNSGSVSATAITIDSANVINSGSFQSSVGPIFIQSSSNVLLPEGGTLTAFFEGVDIACRDLYVTNHNLEIGRSLSLSVTNSLNAGENFWQVYDGFNLWRKPATGDLAETEIWDTAFPYAEVLHTWAGADLGPTAGGFTNNAALGALDLDGGPFSLFTFSGAGPSSNALYVDVLYLLNSATNRDASGNLTALNLNPGMKIYFAQAFIDDGFGGLTDITSELTNNVGLVQVTHVGPLSFKPANKVAPLNIDLRVSVQVTPTPKSVVTWNTSLGATNYLYYMDPQQGAAWQILTNFVSTVQGAVSHADQGLQSSRFYKVRVDQ